MELSAIVAFLVMIILLLLIYTKMRDQSLKDTVEEIRDILKNPKK